MVKTIFELKFVMSTVCQEKYAGEEECRKRLAGNSARRVGDVTDIWVIELKLHVVYRLS
jgi:hypothetical protein